MLTSDRLHGVPTGSFRARIVARVVAGAVLFATVVGCGPRPAGQAVAPIVETNVEASPLLDRAAASFGNRHPHKLEPRFVWARGSGWDMVRHEISGAIVARGVGMGMYVFDTSNSQCWLWVCDMLQQEMGGQWGEPVIPIDTCLAPAQVTCESMDRIIAQQAQGPAAAPPAGP
jgi:hypothetical protein